MLLLLLPLLKLLLLKLDVPIHLRRTPTNTHIYRHYPHDTLSRHPFPLWLSCKACIRTTPSIHFAAVISFSSQLDSILYSPVACPGHVAADDAASFFAAM